MICKEVLVNLHNEDRRQRRCRKAILSAEQGSLAFGPTLHSGCLSFGTKVAFLQWELKSVALLRARPALIPQFMYVAQCLHDAEMSSLEDYGLTSRCVADNLLVLGEIRCWTRQPQALSWLAIVDCLQTCQVFNTYFDRIRVLCSVLNCTFGKDACTGEVLESIDKVMNAQGEMQLLDLWETVKRALRGRTFERQPVLVWLAGAAERVAVARAMPMPGQKPDDTYL